MKKYYILIVGLLSIISAKAEGFHAHRSSRSTCGKSHYRTSPTPSKPSPALLGIITSSYLRNNKKDESNKKKERK